MFCGSFLAVAMLSVSATEPTPLSLPALSVGLGVARAVAIDAQGRVYVAAEELGRVFRVDPSGRLTIVASGLAAPCGLALGAGFLFVSECDGRGVSRIDLGSGTVSRFAGTAKAAPEDDVEQTDGDGGPAPLARLKTPVGLALDGKGDLLIVDRGDHRVRRVAAASGMITTVAGDGIAGDGETRVWPRMPAWTRRRASPSITPATSTSPTAETIASATSTPPASSRPRRATADPGCPGTADRPRGRS